MKESISEKEKIKMKEQLEEFESMVVKMKIELSSVKESKDYIEIKYRKKIKTLNYTIKLYEDRIQDYNEQIDKIEEE